MLVQFDEDVKVLSQIPLTKGIVDQMRDTKMIDSIRYQITYFTKTIDSTKSLISLLDLTVPSNMITSPIRSGAQKNTVWESQRACVRRTRDTAL